MQTAVTPPMTAPLRILAILASTLSLLVSFAAYADRSETGPEPGLREALYQMAKRDFLAHLKNSGLQNLPLKLNSLELKVKSEIDSHGDVKLSRLETKLLVRHPQQLPRVKLIRDFAYSFSEKLCHDKEAEGNETDAARHFMAAFALSLVSGEKFAYQYLTAHESWIIDEDLSQFSSYNFASTVMDFHNNIAGLLAAREERKRHSIEVLGFSVEVRAYTPTQIRTLALAALREARAQRKLVAVYNESGPCSQPSEREDFHKLIHLPIEQSIW